MKHSSKSNGMAGRAQYLSPKEDIDKHLPALDEREEYHCHRCTHTHRRLLCVSIVSICRCTVQPCIIVFQCYGNSHWWDGIPAKVPHIIASTIQKRK
jgi:hypothetical protein